MNKVERILILAIVILGMLEVLLVKMESVVIQIKRLVKTIFRG